MALGGKSPSGSGSSGASGGTCPFGGAGGSGSFGAPAGAGTTASTASSSGAFAGLKTPSPWALPTSSGPRLPGFGAPTGPMQAPNFSNFSQNDPYMKRYLDRIEGRLNDSEGVTQRTIDRATSNIRDATEGRRKVMQGIMARRGVLSGSNLPEWGEGQLLNDEARQVNQAAADISLQRERDNDAFLAGAMGGYNAMAANNLANRQLGLEQWQAQQAAQLAAQRQQMEQWLAGLQGLGALQSLGYL